MFTRNASVAVLDQLEPVIAHRGASAYAPENTLIAFQKAYELGVKWIEFDVKLAACGTLIVFHDATLRRTTNGRGKVATLPYSELAKLDAGSWFAPQFAGEPIPRLDQVLQLINTTKLHANIELKPCKGSDTALALASMECIGKHWQQTALPPLISSQSLTCLSCVRQLDANVPLALICSRWQPRWQDHVEKLNLTSLHFDYTCLTTERVAMIKRYHQRVGVLAFTVNQQQQAEHLFAMGVDSVFSDYADKITRS